MKKLLLTLSMLTMAATAMKYQTPENVEEILEQAEKFLDDTNRKIERCSRGKYEFFRAKKNIGESYSLNKKTIELLIVQHDKNNEFTNMYIDLYDAKNTLSLPRVLIKAIDLIKLKSLREFIQKFAEKVDSTALNDINPQRVKKIAKKLKNQIKKIEKKAWKAQMAKEDTEERVIFDRRFDKKPGRIKLQEKIIEIPGAAKYF